VSPHLRRALDRVRRATDVVDLGVGPTHRHRDGAAPPPAAGGRPTHVWYVSYGSNLLRERFERYLLGGRLPGLDVAYPGGPRTAPPSDERAVVLPGRLRFALDAPAWGGGGVAFWDPVSPGPGVLARAWRVTLVQYLEVVHLENGGRDRRPAPWQSDVLSAGEASVGDSWYSRLVHVGDVDDEPALTFTHPTPGTLHGRLPSSAYGEVVRRGVVETFADPGRGALDQADAAAYVEHATGR
jgi:hypothetical protein